MGATYDPNLLPDHRGEYFQHPKARLIQQDYRDIDKNLIAPWKTYEVLTTGTILLIDAIVNCWKMKINDDSYCKVSFSFDVPIIKFKFLFKIYEFNTHSLQVIVESDSQPDIPPIPILPKPKISPSSPSPSKWPHAFDDFDVSPSKKKSPAKPNKAGSSVSGSGRK